MMALADPVFGVLISVSTQQLPKESAFVMLALQLNNTFPP
jgi:hypothetical protein